MKLYWVKSPKWLRYLFPYYIWHLNPSSKVIYLTFDDGPIPNTTSFILDCLKQHNAKATFFCIGDNAEKHPHLMEKIVAENHVIGNHTHNHINGWKTNTDEYINNCLLAEETLSPYYLNNTKIFRPPFGKCTREQQKTIIKKGYKILMWSVLSADFDQKISNEKCLDNIIKNTSNGNIVILHDSLKTEEKIRYVLPKVLSHFSELGYEFKCVDASML